MSIQLMAETGPLAGGYWEFDAPVNVHLGRDPDMDLPLRDDASASRRHARFEIVPPHVAVRDLGSLNGLFLNGHHIPAQSKAAAPVAAAPDASMAVPGERDGGVALSHGDRVQVGLSVFRVFIPYCATCGQPIPPPFSTQGPLRCAGCTTGTPARGFENLHGPRRHANRRIPAVPRHTLLQLLSRGPTGDVFLARRELDGRLVTVKCLERPDDAFDHGEAFLRRVTTVHDYEHANLVRIFAGGIADGQWFLLREYIPGWTLEGWRLAQPDKRLPIAEVAPLIRQSLDGLAYLHAHGQPHRQLQPGHIFLDATHALPIVKLADPDLAGSAGAATPTDLVLVDVATGGPIAYAAPEQATNSRAANGAPADLFSLAATFYTVLTGSPVYEFSDQDDPLSVFYEGRIIPAAQRDPSMPPALAAWLDRALSLDPFARYASAEAMRRAFDRLSL